MDVKTQGRKIGKKAFQDMWKKAPAFSVDKKTGLGLGKVEVLNSRGSRSRFLFVKDDSTGAVCCYRQSLYNEKWNEKAIPNAYFVRKVAVDSKENVFKTYNSASNVSEAVTNLLSDTQGTAVKDALTVMSDNSKNNGFEEIYEAIKKQFSKERVENTEIRDEYIPNFLVVQPITPSEKGKKSNEIILVDNTGVDIQDSARVHLVAVKQKGKHDHDYQWLVVGPHPNKKKEREGISSLYLLDDLKDKKGNDININSSEELLKNGAFVVGKVRYDKENEVSIKYYKDAKAKSANKQVSAVDVTGDLKAWEQNTLSVYSRFDRPASEKVKETRPTLKSQKALKISAVAVVALAAVLTAGHFTANAIIDNQRETETLHNQNYDEAYASVPDESALAREFGASQMQDRIDGVNGTLLNYENSGLGVTATAGNITNVVNTPVYFYTQQELVKFDGEWIGQDKYDYATATVEGAFEELGKTIANEVSQNGIHVGVREDNSSSISVNYIYGAVDALAPSDALESSDAMEEYLTTVYEDSNLAAAAVGAYEKGYESAVKEMVANPDHNDDLIINEGDIPVVDYTSEDLHTAAAATVASLTKSGKNYDADEINIAYASYEDQVVFANTTDGDYLYQIDLTNGGRDNSVIESTQDMIDKLENADNCKESIHLDTLLSHLDFSGSINQLKKDYDRENGVSGTEIYVADYNTLRQNPNKTTEFRLSPKITYVSDNGARMETKDSTVVTVKQKDRPQSACSEMVAVSVLGDWVLGIYPIYGTIETAPNAVVYENNDLTVAAPEKTQTYQNTKDDRSL